MKKHAKEAKVPNIFTKIIIVTIFVAAVAFVINTAPNYVRSNNTNKTKVIINNNDVTKSLKFDVLVNENETIYMSTKDIANFFDENIYYDNKYNMIITTSNTKIATLELGKNQMQVNGANKNIDSPAIEKDGEFYLPFSELESIYNVEINYIKDNNILTIDSLNREQKKANSSKDANVKYVSTKLSKTVDKIKKGESVIVIKQDSNGWVKIRTVRGEIGYVKDVSNVYTVRENLEEEKQIQGKVSLVWDYFSEYAKAPNRTGTTLKGVNVVSPTFVTLKRLGDGEVDINIGDSGKEYINWAHNKGYKVWVSVSNNSYIQTTSIIMNDYNLRKKLIDNIVNVAIENNFDGINIDFEHMNMEDKDLFSRFIIELAPRLKEYGMVLSVDVTAPDGGEDWSLCYDRRQIAKVADYIVFMAYDQNGASDEIGTVAGADWVEVNINKFIGKQEEVPEEKLILGMPFYTRLWWTDEENNKDSKLVMMNEIDSILPNGVQKVWDKNTKQYYIEYNEDGNNYKMWIEDEKSISEKCDLVNKYNLAGAAYWEKDRETSGVWDVISNKLNVN